MLTSVISCFLTFILPFILTLQAVNFYLRSSSKTHDTEQYNNISVRIVIPWLRYWLCYILLQFVLGLPVIRQIVELIPFNGISLVFFKIWLYSPKYQGSKIIVDGLLLSTFRVKSSDGQFAYLNVLEYIDVLCLWCLSVVNLVASKIDPYRAISGTELYAMLKFKILEINKVIREDFTNSCLSWSLFQFIDRDKDLDELKFNFDQTIGSVYKFLSRVGNFKDDQVTTQRISQRAVSMPSLDETTKTNDVKTYLTSMVSESSLFGKNNSLKKNGLRTRKSYGNLRKGL